MANFLDKKTKHKMYKPTIEEWIEELKRLFPFTHQDKIK